MGYLRLNLKPEQTNIFFKLMEERYRQRPTIITTNLDYSEWANFLGNKALVGALLSRLRHQCHTVKILPSRQHRLSTLALRHELELLLALHPLWPVER